YMLEQRAIAGVRIEIVQDEAGVRHNAGEQIVEVMRDPAREDAEALELLFVANRFFGLFSFRHVLANAHEANGLAAFVPQHLPPAGKPPRRATWENGAVERVVICSPGDRLLQFRRVPLPIVRM